MQRRRNQRAARRRLLPRAIIAALAINIMHEGSGTLATRKPTPPFENVGTKLKRNEDCRAADWLPKLPPRIPRSPDEMSFVPLKLVSIH